MRVSDILEHFLSRADWVDRDTTVDRVIVGNPDADVDRCLVTWMPSFEVLRHMVDRDIRLLICHEPTFWNHWDKRPPVDDVKSFEKLAYIEDHDIVILRNHDCWDGWPGIGIPWAWASYLELGDRPQAIGPNGYQQRYDIQPMSLEALAQRVAARCTALGEPLIQVKGDLSQPVSRIGIGAGCICDIPTYWEMGCDCSIVCDDGSKYWAGIQHAADRGHPVIRVNHGTSEEPGMITLTRYINDHLEGLRAEHLPHGCAFKLVGHTDDPTRMSIGLAQ
jgi:putative NIF3 family GTP cyclohydrolase 1 type 2